jgi:osmotically-inducible protein OsmY
VANYKNNGGRNVAVPDENQPSWRPQDQEHAGHRYRASNEDDHDYRGWRDRNFDGMERDPQRWEGSRGSELGYWEDRSGSTEYRGQGQSGYSAGRYGDDRSQQMQNRNDMRWSPGGFEERGHELGTDDRFSGRSANAWSDRNDRGRERFVGQDNYSRNADQRGYDQHSHERGYQGGQQLSHGRNFDRGDRGYDRGGQSGMGNDRGFSQNGYGGQGYSSGTQHMGYQSSAARGETDWSPSQRTNGGGMGMGMDGRDGVFGRDDNMRDQHVHRGSGPHRGKGPVGYQRSDERIREMVCEALADDDMIDASQIHVTVKDGEVTLSGTVDSRRIKREAEDCVASVSGVRDVQLQLRVRDDQDRSKGQQNMTSSSTGTTATTGTSGTAGASTTQSAAGHVGNGLANGMSNGKTENDTTNQDKKHRA